MVTIYDVAKMANVSIATVSCVISKRKNVKKTTEEKVLNAIKELGYIPNTIAQSLNTHKTNTIGFIIPTIMSPAFSYIVENTENIINKYNYFLYICNSEDNIDLEKSYIIDLEKKWIDGILVTTDNIKTIETLKEIGINFVVVNREFDIENIDSVSLNNEELSYQAVKYLIKTGCKKIAIINGPRRIQTSEKRYAGYKKALDEYGLFDENLVFFGNDIDFTVGIGATVTRQILKKNMKVDGIFCGNDLIAIGTINILFKNNIKIPDEISVISGDESPITKSFEPKLTKIVFPYNKLSKKAVEILFRKINKKKNESILNKKIIIPGNFIVGETTKMVKY